MSKDIVSALMEKCTVLECFAKVRQSSPDNIIIIKKKKKKKKKSTSLRTGMKQSASFIL